ncbi:hypothetical protein [Bacillus cereus]|uniref:hypothetical protein n=1 Tax=Bacillus cereus TaxID=1396 RepID=UPI0009949FDF|nr:hypothetical protein [Bacillus cereus]OOZ86854.1 hypothetical protein BHL25_12955 [Bacillus cereus]
MFHPHAIEELNPDGCIESRFPNFKDPMDFYEVVKIDLSHIHECISAVESNFAKKAIDSTIYPQVINSEEHLVKVVDKAKDVWNYQNTYPQFVRYSFFTGIYSLFEERFTNLCYKYRNRFEKDTLISIDEFKRKKENKHLNGIFLAKEYCENILCMKIDDEMWNRLVYHNQIRNCIVHSRGYTLKTPYKNNRWKKERLENAIRKIDGINTKDNLIKINDSVCLNFIQLAEKFIKYICVQIPLVKAN